MRRIYGIYVGGLLMVGGIAVLTIDAQASGPSEGLSDRGGPHAPGRIGVRPTVYDLLHVLGWGLIVSGILIALVGLIDYWLVAARRSVLTPINQADELVGDGTPTSSGSQRVRRQ